MKHFTQATANGLCTPPCGSSQGKSTSFRFRNSLLMLFLLLIVGSNAAWADWQIRGEGWGGASWVSACPNMTNQNGIWYAKLSSVSSAIQFKVMNGNWDGNNQIWWERSSGGANHNSGNANLENANDSDQDGKHRFKYTPSETVDLYIYTDGSQVWANAVAAGTSSLSGHTVKLHGDLWQNPSGSSDGSKGWGDFASCPTLTLAPGASEVASVSFLIPAVPSDASAEAKARFELYDGNTKKDVGESNVIVTGSGVSKAYSSGKITLTISKSSNTHLVAKQVNVHYSLDNKIRISVTDVTLSGDWYLYYDGTLQSGKFTNAAGSITVNNVPADNSGSYHSFFIAKSNSLTGTSVSHPTGNIRQGVVWLGGLYLDKAGSTTVGGVTYTWENKQYRAGSDGFSTYAGFSIKDKGDARGAFKLSETSNVTFTLNNGVITLTAAANGVVIPTDRTYDGNEYMFFHKTQTSTEANHDHDFSNDDARLFVHFKNAGVDNTSERAFFWDADRTIYAVKVPAGTYKTFKIYRISRETDGWYEWNHSYELNLDYVNDYNYLSATSTSAPTWTSYTPPTFRFVLSGTPALSGDNGEFSHWNGNGTVYTGSTTKILNSGTYKFKINPAGVTTANNMWVNEFNWNDIDAANSSNNINLRKNPANDNTEIWFDLETRSEVTIACDGNKVTVNATPSTPEPLSGDYYVFGAGGTNWVTGWSSNWNNEAYKMTIADGVATKTFYNVSGQGLEFKIHKGETQYKSDLLLAEVAYNNSHLISRVWRNGENIDFSISDINVTHKADVTVHFDGEHIWLTAVPHPETVAGSDWYIMGSGNVGTEHNLEWGKDTQKGRGNEHKMTVQDGIATITYYNVPNNSISYKVFRGSDNYEINDFYYDASASSDIICTDQDGNDNINVSLNNQNICIHWDGTKIWTTEADPLPPTPAIHYDGTEYVFWSTHAPTADWGTIVAGQDRTMWLRFKNTTTNAISKTQHAAFLVEGTENDGSPWGILAAKVPAGDWHQVQVLRVNAGDGWNGSSDISNEWSWFDLEDGKNYLPQRDWGGSRWSTYDLTNKASFFLSGTNNLTGASDWTWNGNGTKYVASVTKTLNPATYKFKLTRDRTIYRSRGDYNSLQWVEEGNMDHFDSEHSNVTCTTPENKQIQFVLSRKADVTIAWENYDKITVNQVPYYNVTFDSDGGSAMDAQELRSGESATNPGSPTRGSGYTFNFWKLSGESSAYDFSTPVTSDIELVADWTAPTLYTVTFDSNGGSPVDAQEVVENETATEPAAPTRDNYTFGGWKLGNVLYDFATPVTDDIELVADWTYTPAHISSVSINESSIYTWAGDAITYTLVPTLVPADIASVTVSWSSSDNNVATVENGVITPQRAGTATITCTATDYYSGSQTATCAVKVAPCAKELAGAPSYNVTITGYNSYEDGDATLTGLWNESSDNTEPATLTVCNVRIGNNGGSNEYYAYDNNGTVSIEQRSSDNVDKWYRIEAATNLYYLKNVSTGNYMYVGPTNTSGSKGIGWTTNSGWYLRSVFTSAANGKTDNYKFYCTKDEWNNDIIVSRADATNNTSRVQENDFVLSRQQLTGNPGNVWNDVVANMVAASRGATQGGNNYKGFQSAFENVENVANPAYIQSQMNSSYYRMKANATVQANLGSALAEADVISVELYADAATSVTLCKSNGDVVATINLNADAAIEYTYLVTAGTPLDGENAFIIKAADNHAGIRSIAVTPMVTADPAQPDLHWTTTPVTAHLLLDGNFTYTAASNDSQGAISYASEDTDVAQVDASTGEVTPSGAGTTNIIATITADECYTTYSISYEVSFLGLQDYIATDGVNSVTLPGDYAGENIVINKAITINGGGHSIGNLTVEAAGDLTLSGALTVNDFSIYAKAGNSSIHAESGQVRNATNLTANGNAYFYYTVDPSGHVQFGWYDFTVPFPVDVMTGIKGIQEGVLKENFVNETDYAIMEHLGDKQAAGQYAYKKFRGIMQPCRLYSITLDDDYNYNTIRFQKTNDGALVAGNSVTLNSYPAGEAKHANWNGVGNGTLHHADAEVSTVGYIQVYQSGTKTFLPVDRGQYSLVIGSAFMVQQAGTMTLNQATHDKLLAPKREESHQLSAISIQIAREGKPFSDQLFISADETAGQGYNQGVDVAKAGNIGNVNVPQIWTNAYNSKLCAHEAQLINGEAQYALSLYAPANGSYTLTSTSIPAGTTLYLTQNDHIIWDMSENYTFDLNKGTTTEYGLLLVQSHKIPTGIENGEWTNDEGRKVLHNGILYILHNGKVFNAQGAVMK